MPGVVLQEVRQTALAMRIQPIDHDAIGTETSAKPEIIHLAISSPWRGLVRPSKLNRN